MKSIAKVILIGNITKDPVYDEKSGRCSMTIAINRKFTSNGEKKEETDFFKLVAWEKLAELCHTLLKRASTVYVEGRLHNFEIDGKVETEVIINEMIDFRRYENENSKPVQPKVDVKIEEKSSNEVQV